MAILKQHTIETAPEAGKPMLEGAKSALGFVPNLYATMVEAPALLKAYNQLAEILNTETDFSPTERQVIWLAISRVNDCDYCMAAHSTLADMQKVPEDVTAAVREGRPIADAKLEALRQFCTVLTDQRGWVDEAGQQTLIDAGYTARHIAEIVLFAGHKTLSNYMNHLAHTPVDAAFAPREWKKAS